MDSKKTIKPVVLVVLDGWGEWDMKKGNAIAQAKLPTIDELNKKYPKTLLQASGLSVGLPWGVCGNSEVGHLTMGVGQILYQFLPTINMAIEDGSYYENKDLIEAIEWTKKNKSALHLVGLVSDGGVHSHIKHLMALLELAKRKKAKKVYIHVITDGRDTDPKSAKQFIETVQKAKVGQIASISGRYYAMDRNNNWDRIEKAYRAFVEGTRIQEMDPAGAVESQYKRGITDEYLEPMTMYNDEGKPVGLIQDNDSIICFNYRKDRSRQLCKAFTSGNFKEFAIKKITNVKFTCFVEYEKGLNADIVFPEQIITTRLGEIISKNGKKQLRMAETEKFAHVTYFFNGGEEVKYDGEERIIVPSKKIDTYSKAPDMSADEVTTELIKAIDSDKYDFILVNYANPDMVGHTGDLKAGVRAVEKVDECLKKVMEKTLKKGGSLIITADHGNVEEMINMTNYKPDTEHSSNPVPCWLVSNENRKEDNNINMICSIDGMIVDIAPTVLALLGIPKPSDMIGRDLHEMCQ